MLLLVALLSASACATTSSSRGGASGLVASLPPPPDADRRVRVPVGDAPTRGPADALVTLVVFTDYECPYCAEAEPTIDELLRAYPRELRVAVRMLPLSFHRHARDAARAALEARAQGGDAAFFAMHARLFESRRDLSRERLAELAGALGLDVDRFRAALEDGRHDAAIDLDRDAALGAGIDGTPAFVIDGHVRVGAEDFATFAEMIEDDIEIASARMDEGLARRDVATYWALHARSEPPPPDPDEEDAARERRRERPERPRAREDRDAPQRLSVPIPPRAPRRGSESPRVVVQVFSDFQCPFCARVLPVCDALLEQYGDRVALVFRHFPLPRHEHAQLAAEAAVEVHAQGGDAAFWAFHDRLFEQSPDLERAMLLELASELDGIDEAQLAAALDDHRHAAAVREDRDALGHAGARELGTPAFLVGEQLFVGAVPLEVLREALEAELSRTP